MPFSHKNLFIAGSAVAALVFGITAVATSGFSNWSSPQSISGGPYSTGTVTLSAGSSSVLSQSISGLQPGYHTEMPVTVINSGTVPFGSITLGLSANPTNSELVSGTGSLDVEVQTCSVAWTPTTTTVNGVAVTTYLCSGTMGTALGVSPSSSSPQTTAGSLLANPSTLVGSNLGITSNHYLITLSMPSDAPNSDQGQSVTLTYTFTGTQTAPGYIGS